VQIRGRNLHAVARRDTQTAGLAAVMGRVYATKAENLAESLSSATSLGTANWLLDN
jgi:hypothetical protein